VRNWASILVGIPVFLCGCGMAPGQGIYYRPIQSAISRDQGFYAAVILPLSFRGLETGRMPGIDVGYYNV
jgi:hypothetical protein